MNRKFKNKNLPKGIMIDRGYVWINIYPNGRLYKKCFGPVNQPGVIDNAIAKVYQLREQIRLGKFEIESEVKRLIFAEAAEIFLKLHAANKKVPKNYEYH